jgi:hypothetical protein
MAMMDGFWSLPQITNEKKYSNNIQNHQMTLGVCYMTTSRIYYNLLTEIHHEFGEE